MEVNLVGFVAVAVGLSVAVFLVKRAKDKKKARDARRTPGAPVNWSENKNKKDANP